MVGLMEREMEMGGVELFCSVLLNVNKAYLP